MQATGQRLPRRSTKARAPAIGRGQFLKTIPLHLLLALASGAGAAVLLALLGKIQFAGRWQYIMLFPLGAIYVNGAVLPVVIPGRHWSLGFLAAMMLVLSCLAGAILSTWIPLPHSYFGAVFVSGVNIATFLALVTGASLGLFYGVLIGTRKALALGAVMGAAGGYIVGLVCAALISHDQATFNQFIHHSLLDFAWQGALGMLVLHAFATLGGLMGTEPAAPATPVASAAPQK